MYRCKVGEVYTNNKGLDFVVIKDYGYIKTSQRVRIKFLISGYENDVYSQNISTGKVKDKYYGVAPNTIFHHTKYGDYHIISFDENNNDAAIRVIIEFLYTGFRKSVRLCNAIDGHVKDPYYPSIYGIACFGEPKRDFAIWEYNTWKHMLSRCYDPNDKKWKSYGGCGVKVDQRWLNFANFLDDLLLLANYDKKLLYPDIYQLDKDFLQRNIPANFRIYSKETCLFIHKQLNEYIRYNNLHDGLPKEAYIEMIKEK